MPLDPGLDALLTAMQNAGMNGLAQVGDPVAARRQFRAMTADIRPDELVIPVGEVTDGQLEGPAGPLAIRIYRPESAESTEATLPTVLFIHGGGWVIGDLETHDNQARRICRETGSVVVSLDYRLAPEAPFPAGVEDAWAALQWVDKHVDELGGDPERLGVAGDSAGGNLSAVVAQRARNAGGPRLAAQFLIYPGVDLAADLDADPPVYPSRIENADGLLLTSADMVWFASHYAARQFETGDLADPDLSPLRAPDLSGLAPALVVVAEYDPLRDEGLAYAAALEAAGTPVTLLRADGMIHGFLDLGPVSPAVEAEIQRATAAFRELLRA